MVVVTNNALCYYAFEKSGKPHRIQRVQHKGGVKCYSIRASGNQLVIVVAYWTKKDYKPLMEGQSPMYRQFKAFAIHDSSITRFTSFEFPEAALEHHFVIASLYDQPCCIRFTKEHKISVAKITSGGIMELHQLPLTSKSSPSAICALDNLITVICGCKIRIFDILSKNTKELCKGICEGISVIENVLERRDNIFITTTGVFELILDVGFLADLVLDDASAVSFLIRRAVVFDEIISLKRKASQKMVNFLLHCNKFDVMEKLLRMGISSYGTSTYVAWQWSQKEFMNMILLPLQALLTNVNKINEFYRIALCAMRVLLASKMDVSMDIFSFFIEECQPSAKIIEMIMSCEHSPKNIESATVLFDKANNCEDKLKADDIQIIRNTALSTLLTSGGIELACGWSLEHMMFHHALQFIRSHAVFTPNILSRVIVASLLPSVLEMTVNRAEGRLVILRAFLEDWAPSILDSKIEGSPQLASLIDHLFIKGGIQRLIEDSIDHKPSPVLIEKNSKNPLPYWEKDSVRLLLLNSTEEETVAADIFGSKWLRAAEFASSRRRSSAVGRRLSYCDPELRQEAPAAMDTLVSLLSSQVNKLSSS
eukprot:TRINITY_DN7562_c0_g1_i3.p1 TRINITY_DN7562_c0_g1~~TRINITY_DN7562_c0_g1_i3.p1  ORF type:complete len:660 (+),score=106.60 TRINITY_DN7562_c0_g1_i3:198-1982(+)